MVNLSCGCCGRPWQSRTLTGVYLCAECEDLQALVDEMEQYVSLGLTDAARRVDAELRGRYPNHTALLDRLKEVSRQPSPSGESTPAEHSSHPEWGESFDLGRELGALRRTQASVTEENLGDEGLADLDDEALTDLSRVFERVVDIQLGEEDFETRYNLGVAYKEMGLLDAAIAQFQLAAKDESRLLECASMLGICFIEKGMPRLAVRWLEKGLLAQGRTEEEYQGLRYDLASALEAAGESARAREILAELHGREAGFRDVVDIPIESLVRLSGLMVTVTRAFRLNKGKLVTEEQDQIQGALRRAEETLSEGRVDKIAECIEELEAAARLLVRLPAGH